MVSRKTFCAQMSRENHEPYIGTAARVDTWLLIEYTEAWEMKAVEQSKLSSQVKHWLHEQAIHTQHLFPAFIRQHYRPLKDITCFVCIVRENRPGLYRFTLQDYDALLSLDLAALAAGDTHYDQYRYNEPLYLICTHGKHDMCCAKYGMPIYHEFTRLAGRQAWQCSHLGGDRFAANIVCLPQSIYYGRITVPDVEILLNLHRQQQLYLEKCRGRTCYTPLEQAAELLLRKEIGNSALNAFSHVSSQYRIESDEHIVTFLDQKTQDMYQITIAHTKQEIASYSSCKGCQLNAIRTFSLRDYCHMPARYFEAAVR